jgi:hypothetical protein
VRNQSHGSRNTLDLYAAVDIPETEGNDILRFNFAYRRYVTASG